MKILHIFILCTITVRTLANRTVNAYTRGGVNIKCSYEDEDRDKIKSFCKLGTQPRCSDLINTEARNSEWTHKGRFSIQDTRSTGYFSVLIRELTAEDTGTYRCAVAASDPIYTVVKLNVTEGLSHEKIISKTVPLGGDMTISCKYPDAYRSEPKFFCRMVPSGICAYKASARRSRKAVKEGKISQHDDRVKQVLTVSMKTVNRQDSGEYWCGAETAGSKDGHKVYVTRVSVAVTDPHVPVSQRPSSLSSSPTSSYLLPTNSNISSTSHPTADFLLIGSPGVTTVCVILALLLVFLSSFLTLTFWKRVDPILPFRRTTHEVPSAGTRRLSNTLFSTAQLPTIPVDSSHAVYANTRFPRVPSNALHTVKATA